MFRRNRVDPFGDLHAVSARGMFTGNRGCLVDGNGDVVRHHRGSLWITCVLSYRDWRHPLDHPGTWTPLFFLDDAVALAAGHRPCGLCRRDDHMAYRSAVANGGPRPSARDLNGMLGRERLRRGKGLTRAQDRILWTADPGDLPDATVITIDDRPHLVVGDSAAPFEHSGWGPPRPRPEGEVRVLTPPTSVLALRNGYQATLHQSATGLRSRE